MQVERPGYARVLSVDVVADAVAVAVAVLGAKFAIAPHAFAEERHARHQSLEQQGEGLRQEHVGQVTGRSGSVPVERH